MDSSKLKEKINKSPKKAGVYQFYDQSKKVIYIGKSINLSNRIKSYFSQSVSLGVKTAKMVSEINNIDWVVVDSEIEALLLEADLIKKNKPKYNSVFKDDKSYLYIKITTGDDVPVVTTARRQKPRRGVVLFGPFPSSSTVKKVLKQIRKIFPYCIHRRPQKSCLYVHLGLCPNPYQSKSARLKYKKDINKIILFLKGKTKQLTGDLIKEMVEYSKNELFEEAAKIKIQISQIEFITQTFRLPEVYIERPTIVQDTINKKLNSLKGLFDLRKIPQRIECYDISNIMGKHSTGSMVVFTNGQPDKSEYRRFKIITKNTPDDFAMIKEVLTRRFKNDWQRPDLIIIDGGKGQLAAACDILKLYKLETEVISIAKRFEEIYTGRSKNPIKLEKDNPALQLIQQARDEAHRFAIFYHRKLRSKDFLILK